MSSGSPKLSLISSGNAALLSSFVLGVACTRAWQGLAVKCAEQHCVDIWVELAFVVISVLAFGVADRFRRLDEGSQLARFESALVEERNRREKLDRELSFSKVQERSNISSIRQAAEVAIAQERSNVSSIRQAAEAAIAQGAARFEAYKRAAEAEIQRLFEACVRVASEDLARSPQDFLGEPIRVDAKSEDEDFARRDGLIRRDFGKSGASAEKQLKRLQRLLLPSKTPTDTSNLVLKCDDGALHVNAILFLTASGLLVSTIGKHVQEASRLCLSQGKPNRICLTFAGIQVKQFIRVFYYLIFGELNVTGNELKQTAVIIEKLGLHEDLTTELNELLAKHFFLCGICFNYLDRETQQAKTNCPHQFCLGCLKQHFGRPFLGRMRNQIVASLQQSHAPEGLEEIIAQTVRQAKPKCCEHQCGVVLLDDTAETVVPGYRALLWEFHRRGQLIQRGVAAGWRTVECPNGECVGVGYVEASYFFVPTVQCWICNQTFQGPTSNVRWTYGSVLALVASLLWVGHPVLLLLVLGILTVAVLGNSKTRFGVNQKPCPRCGLVIEKNAGCDHMTCRCGHHFYWTTLRPYP